MTRTTFLFLFLCACGTTQANPDASTDASSDASSSTCALAQNTTKVSTFANCDLLSRDTSSCKASRQAAGLDGFWLKFSCRVTLSASGGTVTIKTDSEPDYKTQYFKDTDPCTGAQTSQIVNPNRIAAQNITVSVPQAPSSMANQAMAAGAVGVAVNGVTIFNNQAAPGDDIFQELATFDACGGHPQMSGMYHYHTEPLAISHDDSALIGVMRDGYPIYGRKDADNSTPTLDAQGGHTSVTPDSTTPVYHYHANEQKNAKNQTAWFLTTGTYHGAPGACTGCM